MSTKTKSFFLVSNGQGQADGSTLFETFDKAFQHALATAKEGEERAIAEVKFYSMDIITAVRR